MSIENKNYRYMPLRSVLPHVPEMKRKGVSEVARSKRGFLTAYNKAKTSSNLSEKWENKRREFIARHLAQYKKNPTPRRKLALIAWAYNPK